LGGDRKEIQEKTTLAPSGVRGREGTPHDRITRRTSDLYRAGMQLAQNEVLAPRRSILVNEVHLRWKRFAVAGDIATYDAAQRCKDAHLRLMAAGYMLARCGF